ncbi:hypothetical protein [Roseateles noduli]|uniref:hypothetical protein n=1 Tax=Roseateles noduli TaxID=2052484 RepID=UPI003D64E8F3
MPARAALILTTAVLVLMLGAANAQDVPKAPPQQERTFGFYRCGPEGQDLRDSPCPEGQGRKAEVPKDPVDPKEADTARKRTAAETRDLAVRERERERQSAKAPPKAAGIDGRLPGQRAAKPAKPADPKKPKPKDPKKPPKKKPKVPKSPDGALQPKPTTSDSTTTPAAR